MFRHKIHKVDPYAGLLQTKDIDLQGWGGHDLVLKEMIRQYRPRTVVEVGTWKGQSAVTMALEARALQCTTEIICVDTWLGAEEFWYNLDDPDRYKSFAMRNGYPQVYYTFLNNVVAYGLEPWITPFPISSVQGALVLDHFDVLADMVYIDAGHSYDAVYADCVAYWPVTSKVMFGHDARMDSVKSAIHDFVSLDPCDFGCRFRIEGDFWFLEKETE